MEEMEKAFFHSGPGESLVVIGVGAGRVFGVRTIFAKISPNLPEKNSQRK